MADVWTLSHGQDGTTVDLHEVPVWAYLAEQASEWVLTATHPLFCCGDWPWAWKIAWAPPPPGEKPDEDGWVYNPHTLGHALHSFGNQLAGGFGAWRRYKTKARIPVPPDWVREHIPDAGWPFDGSSGDEMSSTPGDEGDILL